MAASRTSGAEAQAANLPGLSPEKQSFPLDSEILRGLPLEWWSCSSKILKTSKSFRIIDLNPRRLISPGQHWKASAAGHWLNSQSSWSPRSSVSASMRCMPEGQKTLGEISYGNELIRQGPILSKSFLCLEISWCCFRECYGAQACRTGLRENDERFRLLIEGVKEYAIFRLDLLGHVVSWNAGAERLKGLPRGGNHRTTLSPCFILEKMYEWQA